jgi:hypothetical protein
MITTTMRRFYLNEKFILILNAVFYGPICEDFSKPCRFFIVIDSSIKCSAQSLQHYVTSCTTIFTITCQLLINISSFLIDQPTVRHHFVFLWFFFPLLIVKMCFTWETRFPSVTSINTKKNNFELLLETTSSTTFASSSRPNSSPTVLLQPSPEPIPPLEFGSGTRKFRGIETL